MAEVLRRAVRNPQQVPESDLDRSRADGVTIPLKREAILRARDRARGLSKPHNVARKLFVTEILAELARAESRVLAARWKPRTSPMPGSASGPSRAWSPRSTAYGRC